MAAGIHDIALPPKVSDQLVGGVLGQPEMIGDLPLTRRTVFSQPARDELENLLLLRRHWFHRCSLKNDFSINYGCLTIVSTKICKFFIAWRLSSASQIRPIQPDLYQRPRWLSDPGRVF